MSKRTKQIIKNMEFFCKLANLKEFNYPIKSFNVLKEYINKHILFPSIGYYNTFFIKFRYYFEKKNLNKRDDKIK